MADYISKGFNSSIEYPSTTQQMTQRFESMLKKVANMIVNQGPIYHVWIAFQVGTDDDDALVFETDTTNPQKSVIASLSVEKTGSDTANSFTLTVIVDPFNFGQETTNQIEKLDELVADALSHNIDDEGDHLRGYIQYGYVYPDDADLCSPKYEFVMTQASSTTKTSSGISTYTFEGSCAITSDCNYLPNIEAVTDTSRTIMNICVSTLFKYYGTNDNKPNDITDDCDENNFGYTIQVDDDIYNDSPTLSDLGVDQLDAADETNPFTYIESLFSKYPLSKTELDSGDWDDMSGLTAGEKPGYRWWLTDENDEHVIHISHYNPNLSDAEEADKQGIYSVDYDITWGKQQKNLVLEWNPSVDLYTYVIRKASYLRVQAKLAAGETEDLENVSSDYKEAIQTALDEETLDDEQSVINEQYNATITLVGIPADIPISARLNIFPRVLESVSRTKGTYSVTGSSDEISTKGTYETTINLFRLSDATETQDDSGTSSSTTTSTTTTTTTSSSSTTASGGGVR